MGKRTLAGAVLLGAMALTIAGCSSGSTAELGGCFR